MDFVQSASILRMAKLFKRSSLIRERKSFFILLSTKNKLSALQSVTAVHRKIRNATSVNGNISFKSFCLINRLSCL